MTTATETGQGTTAVVGAGAPAQEVPADRRGGSGWGLAGLRLPAVHVPLPSGREVLDVVRVAGSFLPERKRLVYYAGLGALAAGELIEWPVAVAIGIGTEVARRSAGPQAAGGRGERDATDVAAGAATGTTAEATRAAAETAARAAESATGGTAKRPARKGASGGE